MSGLHTPSHALVVPCIRAGTGIHRLHMPPKGGAWCGAGAGVDDGAGVGAGAGGWWLLCDGVLVTGGWCVCCVVVVNAW